jgi:hypothetical protein
VDLADRVEAPHWLLLYTDDGEPGRPGIAAAARFELVTVTVQLGDDQQVGVLPGDSSCEVERSIRIDVPRLSPSTKRPPATFAMVSRTSPDASCTLS